MNTLIIVNQTKDWTFKVDSGIAVVSARTYLTDATYAEMKRLRIFNLCRTYRYQSLGYYVSLLAQARGHRAIPSITTIQDFKSQSIVRILSDEIDELIQKSLSQLKSDHFTLSIYFGRNIAKHYELLSKQLHSLFQAPILRAQFARTTKKWVLQTIVPIPLSEIPDHHLPYFADFAQQYFAKKRLHAHKKTDTQYDLAILTSPDDSTPPSNKRALQHFIDAGEEIGFRVECITKDDYGRLAEFDGLFIRETTSVNHYTYRFARRALAEGLVVIDDPDSIVRCTNKVYLTEALQKAKIPIPKTLILHKKNIDTVLESLSLPCVLKLPDSSFSQGIVKVHEPQALVEQIELLLERSDLILAQEYLPTAFDWRIGVLDKKPLFACKYFMAKNHWQIYKWKNQTSFHSGSFETLDIHHVPPRVVKLAVKAANLIGNGFYGVDIKESGRKLVVMEINDNPSVEAGVEDVILGEKLYVKIMHSFLKRIQQKKQR